jgi:hypothetical protein
MQVLVIAFSVRAELHVAVVVGFVVVAIRGLVSMAIEAVDLDAAVAAAHVPSSVNVEHAVVVGVRFWLDGETASREDKDGTVAYAAK